MSTNAHPTLLQTAAPGRAGARRSILPAILLVALALRVYAAATLPCISRDGVFFVQYAQQIRADAAQAMRAQTKQPGYSLLLLAAYHGGGSHLAQHPPLAWERTGQVLSIAGGVFGVLLIYWLTARLFDPGIALFAAGLAAIWPQQIALSGDVLSDAPHQALFIAAILMAARAMSGQLAAAAAAGALAGLAYLLRQEALAAVVAAAGAVMLFGRVAPRRRAIATLILLAGFVVVVAPHSVVTGKWMPNKSIDDLFFGPTTQPRVERAPNRAPTAREPRVERAPNRAPTVREGSPRATRPVHLQCRRHHETNADRFQTGAALILAAPVNWWNGPGRMAAAWSRSGAYVVSTLALLGFFWGRAPRADVPMKRLVAPAAGLLLVAAELRGLAFGEISQRYLLVVVGLSIPWAASGLHALVHFVREKRPNASTALIGALLLLVSVPMLYRARRPAAPASGWLRPAGLFIAAEAGENDTVLAPRQLSAVAFYADRRRVWPPGPSLAEMLADPRVRDAAWFVDPPEVHHRSAAETDFVNRLRKRLSGVADCTEWSIGDGETVRLYQRPAGGWELGE